MFINELLDFFGKLPYRRFIEVHNSLLFLSMSLSIFNGIENRSVGWVETGTPQFGHTETGYPRAFLIAGFFGSYPLFAILQSKGLVNLTPVLLVK